MKSTWLILGLAIATANAFPYGKNVFSEFRVGAPKVCTMLGTPPEEKISFSDFVASKFLAAKQEENTNKLTVTKPMTSQGGKKIDNLKIDLSKSRAMTKTAYIVSGMHACPCAQKISAAFVKKAVATDCSAAKKPKICTTAINLVMQANPDRIELYNPALTDVKSKYFSVGGTDIGTPSCEGANINRDFKQDFKAVDTGCPWNFAGKTAENIKETTELKAQLAALNPDLVISIVSPKTGETKSSLCYPKGQKTEMSAAFKAAAPSVEVKEYAETDMGGTLVHQFYKTTTAMPKYAYELQCTESIDVDKTVDGLIKLIDAEVDTPTVPTTVSTTTGTTATTMTTMTTGPTTTNSISTTTNSISTTTQSSSTTMNPSSVTTTMPTSTAHSTSKSASTNAATSNSAATSKATTMATTPKTTPSVKTVSMPSTLTPPSTHKTTMKPSSPMTGPTINTSMPSSLKPSPPSPPPPTPEDKEKAFAMVGKAPLGEFFNKSVLRDAQDFLASTYKYKVAILPPDNSILTSTGKSFQITQAKPFGERVGRGSGRLRKKVLILGGNILTASLLGKLVVADKGDPTREQIFQAISDINPDRENGKTKNALPDPSKSCTPATLNGIHILSNFRKNWKATTDACAPKNPGFQVAVAAAVKYIEKLVVELQPNVIVSMIYDEDSCRTAKLHYTATNTATFTTSFKAGYDGAAPTTEKITVENTDYPGNAIGSLSDLRTEATVFGICAPRNSTNLQVGLLADKIAAGLANSLTP